MGYAPGSAPVGLPRRAGDGPTRPPGGGDIAAHADLRPPAPLEKHHRFDHFDCGNPPFNEWLARHARAHASGSARVFVTTLEDGETVVGYYALAAAQVAPEAAAKGEVFSPRSAPGSAPLEPPWSNPHSRRRCVAHFVLQFGCGTFASRPARRGLRSSTRDRPRRWVNRLGSGARRAARGGGPATCSLGDPRRSAQPCGRRERPRGDAADPRAAGRARSARYGLTW